MLDIVIHLASKHDVKPVTVAGDKIQELLSTPDTILLKLKSGCNTLDHCYDKFYSTSGKTYLFSNYRIVIMEPKSQEHERS